MKLKVVSYASIINIILKWKQRNDLNNCSLRVMKCHNIQLPLTNFNIKGGYGRHVAKDTERERERERAKCPQPFPERCLTLNPLQYL